MAAYHQLSLRKGKKSRRGGGRSFPGFQEKKKKGRLGLHLGFLLLVSKERKKKGRKNRTAPRKEKNGERKRL